MAWGAFTAIGGANANASATSLAMTLTAAVAVGDIILVGIAVDNTTTTDGATTDITSVVDSVGNVYTRLVEWTNGNAAAAAGVTGAIWAAYCATAMTTSDTITASYSARVGQVMVAEKAAVGAGMTFQSVGTPQGGVADANATGPLTTLGGLPSAEHAWIGLDAIEAPGADAYVVDTDFTASQQRGTAGAGAAGMSVRMQKSIFTGTTRTHGGSKTGASDWVSMLVALDEVLLPVDAGPAFIGGGWFR